MKQLEKTEWPQSRLIITSKFIEPGLEYWFSNHDHVRSPFPIEIKDKVKTNTSTIFFEWIDGLKKEELKKMDENEFVEMFETILFNEALKLVNDPDKQLTIAYPFMPRLGDKVNHTLHGQGTVVNRKETVTKENKKLFELTVTSHENGNTWETQFELKD